MIKLSNLIKEIKVNKPGTSILWGYNDFDEFMELVKLKGFKTPQKALDEINKLLKEDEPYYTWEDVPPPDNPSYAYLAGDGQVTFVKDISEFGVSYETEEGWGITQWSEDPPL
jgi:hypothetical protein